MPQGVRSKTMKGLRRVAAYWRAQSDLERLVATHYGPVVNKWRHYYEIYERHFDRIRERGDVSLLEIGVAAGGSLDLWRRYFGPSTRIVGLDINPDCQRFARDGTDVMIGSQSDPEFLASVVAKHGPFDIVIDDGSHAFDHQITTFRALFPHIKPDGVYSCEDLCTSYWADEFGGGVRKPGTFIEFAKTLIDELNAWHWREGVENEPGAFASAVHGMHFYPSLLVIDKRAMTAPVVTPVGIREKH
jgi:hypothetical protein